MRNAQPVLSVLTNDAEGHFEGTVTVDAPFGFSDPENACIATIEYASGAHTAWHSHSHGQTLIVKQGRGWYQREHGPIEEIGEGDIIWTEPHQRHWHGAAPESSVTLLSIIESDKHPVVRWGSPVNEKSLRRESVRRKR